MTMSISDFISGKFHTIQSRVPVKLSGFTADSQDISMIHQSAEQTPAEQPQSFEDQLITAGQTYSTPTQDFLSINTPSATGDVTVNDHPVTSGTVIFPNIKPAPRPEPEPLELSVDDSGENDGMSPDREFSYGSSLYPTKTKSAGQKVNLDYLNQYGDAEVQQMILKAVSESAQNYNVNESLIKAIIMQESSFSPTALSHAGAQGLMQLMPGTADYLGVSNPWDIRENIDGGTRLIGQYLDNYDGNLELALAAYNAGPGAVSKYGGIPPYSETQNYVKKVIGYFDKYLEEWYS